MNWGKISRPKDAENVDSHCFNVCCTLQSTCRFNAKKKEILFFLKYGNEIENILANSFQKSPPISSVLNIDY